MNERFSYKEPEKESQKRYLKSAEELASEKEVVSKSRFQKFFEKKEDKAERYLSAEEIMKIDAELHNKALENAKNDPRNTWLSGHVEKIAKSNLKEKRSFDKAIEEVVIEGEIDGKQVSLIQHRQGFNVIDAIGEIDGQKISEEDAKKLFNEYGDIAHERAIAIDSYVREKQKNGGVVPLKNNVEVSEPVSEGVFQYTAADVADILESVKQDVSLENVNENDIEVTLMHTGKGFSAKGTVGEKKSYGSGLYQNERYSRYDTTTQKSNEWTYFVEKQGDFQNLVLILYGIGTNMDQKARSATRGGGLFGVSLEHISGELSEEQNSKLVGLLHAGLEKGIRSNKFKSVTTTESGGVLARGSILDTEVYMVKEMMQEVIKEYKNSESN